MFTKRILNLSNLLLIVALLQVALSGGTMLSTAQGLQPSASQGLNEPPPTPLHSRDRLLINHLQQTTKGRVRISYHAGTGKVRFIGTDSEHAILQPTKLAVDATPEVAARQFLATYGQLFGLTDQAQELTVMRTRTLDLGHSFVRFQQVYQGIPVIGGELVVQMNRDKNVISANGEILPGLSVNVIPTVSAETAQQQAIELVSKSYGLTVDNLATTEPELWIYNPILLSGPGPRFSSLVWRMEVQPKELLPVGELVLVDAHLGVIALHFNQIATAKNRLTYDAQNGSNLPGVLRRSEGQGPYGNTDVDSAHDYAGDTYDFYHRTHGRDSIDNAGMTITSTVHYYEQNFCSKYKAGWNGSQMVYCDGYPQADDVVAHELTHGVTQYESHLFYYMQSGAINEAFSDIWGEFIDLTNGAGNDTAVVRWLIGEDSPIGALRSMSNPPAYSDPDRMTDNRNYDCSELDNGGVHTNSGIGNKAAYLLVDGNTFNGYTVTGIGMDKTAKIFYEVQTNMFTSAADYNDLYDDLYQACVNLIGTSGITSNDCQQVKNAVDATEMNQQPQNCPIAPEAPLVCPDGLPPFNLFFDDMENTASGNWQHDALAGTDRWYYPQTPNPLGFDSTYATSGQYNLWGYDQPDTADYYIAMTSDVSLPAGSTSYLYFNHAYGFDDLLGIESDGGVLEYSRDGGVSWSDAGALFTHNGYNGTIFSSLSDNPLRGRQAFVGESNGYTSSRLVLSSLAGQNVRFRFRIGTNGLGWDYGWFIDDFRIYACDHEPSLSAPSISPGDTGDIYTNFQFFITYSDPENQPPSYVKLIINGTPLNMSPIDLSDTNYVDGAVYTYSSTFAQGFYTYYYRASDGINVVDAGFTSHFRLMVNAPSTSRVTVTANPQSIELGGGSVSRIDALVLDEAGNPVVGQLVQFTADSGEFFDNTAYTGDDGIATSYFLPNRAGNILITAISEGQIGSVIVNVYEVEYEYDIQLSAEMVESTETYKKFELRTYVTYANTGETVYNETITFTTDRGTFQNGLQAISANLVDGELDPYDPNFPRISNCDRIRHGAYCGHSRRIIGYDDV